MYDDEQRRALGVAIVERLRRATDEWKTEPATVSASTAPE